MTTETTEAATITFIDTDQLKKDVDINVTDLTTDMKNHTGLQVHYAMQSVRARRQLERCKIAAEVIEAQLDAHWRTTLKEENAKTTEAQIRAAIVADARYRATQAKLIDAQTEFRYAEAAANAFDGRRELLLQIARDAAREQAGPLRVMANQDAVTKREQLLETMKKASTGT